MSGPHARRSFKMVRRTGKTTVDEARLISIFFVLVASLAVFPSRAMTQQSQGDCDKARRDISKKVASLWGVHSENEERLRKLAEAQELNESAFIEFYRLNKGHSETEEEALVRQREIVNRYKLETREIFKDE